MHKLYLNFLEALRLWVGFHYAAPVKMPYVNLLQHERSCYLVIQIDRDTLLVMVQAAAPG